MPKLIFGTALFFAMVFVAIATLDLSLPASLVKAVLFAGGLTCLPVLIAAALAYSLKGL
jgi:hypothetical protein